MAVGSVLAFWAVAVLLIAVPGADWAFTIGAAVRGQRIAPAVGGLVIGYTAMTLVVAAGVGAFVAATPVALTALTVTGGGYLVWLGLRTLSSAGPAIVDPDRRETGTLVRGIVVSGLNPKGLLLFVALLPQFTDARGSWPMTVQIGLLGLVFTLTCAAFYPMVGVFAQTVLRARPGVARLVQRVSGVAMVVIGVSLLIEMVST